MRSADAKLETMLDIGPHKGDFTERVAKAVGATSVSGIELIPDHIAAAEARGIAVTLGDVDDGAPLPRRVVRSRPRQPGDRARPQHRQFMTEVRRVLRPNGIACISTNNLSSWHNIISLTLGHQPMPMHVSDEVILGNPLNPEHGFGTRIADARTCASSPRARSSSSPSTTGCVRAGGARRLLPALSAPRKARRPARPPARGLHDLPLGAVSG